MSKLPAVALIAALGTLGARQGDPTALAPRATAPAAAVPSGGVDTNVDFAFHASIFVACANNGAGETVTLGGLLHQLYNVTLDAQGYAHVKMQAQPRGVSGTGSVTGDMYRGTGVTSQVLNTRLGQVESFENIVNIIGQGPGNNLYMHQTAHVTIAPDGTVSADQGEIRIDCR